MLDVKEALAAKCNGDATLIGAPLLNGQHVYQVAPQIDTKDLDAWATFSEVARSTDEETGFVSQVYQFDVWSRTSDRGDRVAERLSILLKWQPGVAGTGTLAGLTTRRLALPVAEIPATPELRDDSGTGTLHHKIRQFRVATYPV